MPIWSRPWCISLVVLAALMLWRRDLLLFCFDPTHARSIGLRTGSLHYLLLTLLSLAAVAGLQSVGIILVVAMLVTPGATAYLLTDRFDRMTILAVASAVLATVIGVLASYWLDASTAGCIVLVQTLQFVLVMVFAPRHGLMAQGRYRRLAHRRPPGSSSEAAPGPMVPPSNPSPPASASAQSIPSAPPS